jgi:hypothetical protein
MKRLFSWTSIAVAPAFLVVLATAARAEGPAIRVEIPFSFTAGNQVLPAGEYRFTVDTEHMLSRITPENSTATYMVRLVPGSSERKPDNAQAGMVRFQKLGDRYVLNGIWRSGFVMGNGVIAPHNPREMASTAASVAVTALQ